MANRNFQARFSRTMQQGGVVDARQKIIRGRIEDARQILNRKKAQLKRTGFIPTRNQKINNMNKQMQFTTRNTGNRLGMNKRAIIGQIRNRQNVGLVTRNTRLKVKNDVIFQRRKLLTGTGINTPAGRGKQIKLRGGSIQVTAKQSSPMSIIQLRESNDELETMTFSDLPDFSQQQVAVPSLPSRMLAPAQVLTAAPTQLLAAAPVAASSAYTILVSNLHPSVTEEDIQELFGAVGTIGSTKFLHPGAALVSYFSKEEALTACSSYHNRLLDSQPMQCSLLSHADQQKGRTSIQSRLGGRLASQSSSAHNFARVALSQYIPTTANQTLRSHDPIFNVRLS